MLTLFDEYCNWKVPILVCYLFIIDIFHFAGEPILLRLFRCRLFVTVVFSFMVQLLKDAATSIRV
jgi:hypothetical protein